MGFLLPCILWCSYRSRPIRPQRFRSKPIQSVRSILQPRPPGLMRSPACDTVIPRPVANGHLPAATVRSNGGCPRRATCYRARRQVNSGTSRGDSPTRRPRRRGPETRRSRPGRCRHLPTSPKTWLPRRSAEVVRRQGRRGNPPKSRVHSSTSPSNFRRLICTWKAKLGPPKSPVGSVSARRRFSRSSFGAWSGRNPAGQAPVPRRAAPAS
jgi:hypothetical protein